MSAKFTCASCGWELDERDLSEGVLEVSGLDADLTIILWENSRPHALVCQECDDYGMGEAVHEHEVELPAYKDGVYIDSPPMEPVKATRLA